MNYSELAEDAAEDAGNDSFVDNFTPCDKWITSLLEGETGQNRKET